uniref:N-acetyltransferase domain-containing protein n=2 Tax=Clastoptera arizonana TaxID=38151 RepID=A0A1B6E1D1_9HEMI
MYVNHDLDMKKWGETADTKIEFYTMSKEEAEESLQVIREAFFPFENVSVGCEVKSNPAACKELELLCLEAANDGVSILAREKGSHKIVGVSYNKIQTITKPGEKSYFEKFRDEKCKEQNSICLMNDMIKVDSAVDAYGAYDANCSMEIMFLATLPDYRRRGIATDLVKYSVELGSSLIKTDNTNVPQIVTSLFTSIGTYKIGKKLAFDELHFCKWNEFEFQGVSYDKKIDSSIHPGITLMVKRL